MTIMMMVMMKLKGESEQTTRSRGTVPNRTIFPFKSDNLFQLYSGYRWDLSFKIKTKTAASMI